MEVILRTEEALDLSMPKPKAQDRAGFPQSGDWPPKDDLPNGNRQQLRRSWTYDDRIMNMEPKNGIGRMQDEVVSGLRYDDSETTEDQYMANYPQLSTTVSNGIGERDMGPQYKTEAVDAHPPHWDVQMRRERGSGLSKNRPSRNYGHKSPECANDAMLDSQTSVDPIPECGEEIVDGRNDSFRWDLSTVSHRLSKESSGDWSDISDSCHDSNDSGRGHSESEAGQVNNVIRRLIGVISISLHDSALWRTFSKHGTEMIINRGGRRLFPRFLLSINGLEPDTKYSVILKVSPFDDRRYKFVKNKWMTMGVAVPQMGRQQSVTHHDSPSTGRFWQHRMVSFSKVRLTNNKDSSSEENILLHSMHKYNSSIIIRKESTMEEASITFDFPEATYIAVTAYQNNKITELKIQNNPFAKAFRDSGHSPTGYANKQHGRRSHVKRNNSLPYLHDVHRNDPRYATKCVIAGNPSTRNATEGVIARNPSLSMASEPCPYNSAYNHPCRSMLIGRGVHDPFFCTNPYIPPSQMAYLR